MKLALPLNSIFYVCLPVNVKFYDIISVILLKKAAEKQDEFRSYKKFHRKKFLSKKQTLQS